MSEIQPQIDFYRKPPEINSECRTDIDYGVHVISSNYRECYHEGSSSGYSIKLVNSGVEKYSIDNKFFNLDTKRLLFVNPESNLEVSIRSEEPVHGVCLYYSENYVQEVWRNLILSEEELLDQKEVGLSFEFISGLYDKVVYSVDPSDILEYAIRETTGTHKLINKISAGKRSTREAIYWKVRKAIDVIRDQWTRDICLDVISRETGMSKYHLIRSFKNVAGLSPIQYAQQYRLEKSKEMIRKNIPLSDIAEKLGYADLPTYSKAFKRQTKMSPSDWKIK